MWRMKKVFEGVIGHEVPEGWDDAWDAMRNDAREDAQNDAGNPWMKVDVLRGLAGSGDSGVTFVMHDAYQCCEYPQRLNILTFRRWKLSLPFRVIGLPASLSGSGYRGDLAALIRDYRNRRGLFLLLNLERTDGIPPDVVSGHTLPTCIFDNTFETFDQYLATLRSSYRRRVRTALARGKDLEVRAIPGNAFTPEMYRLYRAVHSRSDYPLETLDIDFFQRFDASIHALYDGDVPLAFVMTRRFGDRLYFLFGGMDYAERDRFDLYYNMLLTIVRIGIDTRVASIDFGQTAEGVKTRIGCRIQPKYLCAFSSNRLIHGLFRIFRASLEYAAHPENCRSRKDEPARGTTSP
jgi:hypothetical protein